MSWGGEARRQAAGGERDVLSRSSEDEVKK